MFLSTSMRYRFRLLSVLFLFCLAAGCNQNEDQRNFEREAYNLPQNFTETTSDKEIISEDPDDWRVAPFFQGLVEIDPAYPNPVAVTDVVRIDYVITGIEAVSGITVVVFFENGEQREVYRDSTSPLPPGVSVIPINASELRQFPSSRGLQRVIILDRNQNVISYGDIMIE